VAYRSTKHVAFGGTNERVDMGDVLNFERTDTFSISFWCRFTGTGAMSLVSKMGAAAAYTGIQIYVQSHVRLQLLNTFSSNELDVRTTTTISDGDWHHVCITYDGTSIPGGCHIYIDNNDESLTTVASTLSASILTAATLQFGDRSAAPLPYTGDLDDIGIWDAELTSGEVTAIYNSGNPNDLSLLPTSANLVGWWKMGDGDTFNILQDSGIAGTNLACLDLSPSGNDGTPTNMESGDVSSDVAGGRASTFNGTDEYVTMGDVLGFEYTDSFSISCWFKCTSSGAAGFTVCKQDGSARGYALGLNAGNSYAVDFHLRNAHPGNRILVQSTTNGLDDGLWHHLVATWNGNASPGAAGVNLYIDGVAETPIVDTDTLSATILTTASLNIGARNDGVDAHWDGSIDDVSIHAAELSPVEVIAIYNSGTPTDLRALASSANLVGYWRMGDGATSPTIPDAPPQYIPLTTCIDLNNDAVNESVDFGHFAEVSFTLNTPWSFGVWIKWTSSTSGIVFGKYVDSPSTGWYVYVTATHVIFRMDNASNSGSCTVSLGQVTNDGNWHHIVCTYDGSNLGAGFIYIGMTIYVDGVTFGQGTSCISMYSISSASALLKVGLRMNSLFINEFIGKVCHSSVYDKELSQAEITALYATGVPQDLLSIGPTANLVHWSALGNGDAIGAGNVNDLSTLGNDGTTANVESGDFVSDAPVGSGNDGTTANMDATNFVDGVPGDFSYASFDLDGVNEFVTMGDVLGFEYNVACSFSIWFKTSDTGVNKVLVSKQEGATTWRGYRIIVAATSGKIQMQWDNDSLGVDIFDAATNNGGFHDGNWHHVCVTKSTGYTVAAFTVYVDGVAEAITATTDALTATILTTNSFQVGARDVVGSEDPFLGTLDEVAVYDVELTADQVAAIYAFGAPVDLTALGSWADAVGYWRMGEASFDGTMINMESGDIVEGGGPGWEWGSMYRGLSQRGATPIARPQRFPQQAKGRYATFGVNFLGALALGDLPVIRRPAELDPVLAGGVTITNYFRMRGVDDGTATYTTWTAVDNPDPDGTQANGGNTTPALVGSITAGSGTTLHSWTQES